MPFLLSLSIEIRTKGLLLKELKLLFPFFLFSPPLFFPSRLRSPHPPPLHQNGSLRITVRVDRVLLPFLSFSFFCSICLTPLFPPSFFPLPTQERFIIEMRGTDESFFFFPSPPPLFFRKVLKSIFFFSFSFLSLFAESIESDDM